MTDFVDLNTIHVPTANTRPPAAWGAQVNDNFAFVEDRPFVHLQRTGDFSFTAAVERSLPFQVVHADTYGMYDASTADDIVNIRRDGLYLISWSVNINQNGNRTYAGVKEVASNKWLSVQQQDPNATNAPVAMSNQTIVNLNSGDSMYVRFYQDGTAPIFNAPINHLSVLWVGEKVSAVFP